MFQIVCDPSSGSVVLYLTEIIRSGSQVIDCNNARWKSEITLNVCYVTQKCPLRRIHFAEDRN